jgi:hypothetical protein
VSRRICVRPAELAVDVERDPPWDLPEESARKKARTEITSQIQDIATHRENLL